MSAEPIAFHRPETEPAQRPQRKTYSDAEFLHALQWKTSAPVALVQAAREGDRVDFCRLVRKQWPRQAAAEIKKRATSGRWPVWHSLWSRNLPDQTDRCERLFTILEKLARRAKSPQHRRSTKQGTSTERKNGQAKRKSRWFSSQQETELLDWLESVSADEPLTAGELLAVEELLLHLGGELPAEIHWRLWRAALTAARELFANDPAEREDTSGDFSAIRTALHGELYWLSGLLFAPVKRSEEPRRTGGRILRRELLERTDTDGTPQAELLSQLTLWLAPLVRARHWADLFGETLWNDNAEERFDDLLQSVVPLCNRNGRLALSGESDRHLLPVLRLGARLLGWSRGFPPQKYLHSLDERSSPKRSRRWSGDIEPPAGQSDWAQLASLRSGWAPDADALLLTHHGDFPQLELTTLGRPLLCGTWDIHLSLDEEPAALDEPWTCVCWYSDDDADYLELQSAAGSLRVERQVLLSREEHFALLSDSLAGAKTSRVDYTARLPLVEGVTAEADIPTREITLKAPRQAARLFPLSLPDDRVMSAAGGFSAEEDHVELRQTGQGGLYAPVLIDWHPHRRRTPAEWQSLTVTEERQLLRPEKAAAHRLRLGTHQLLIYRSLMKTSKARAVLGHHTRNETVIGHFDDSGEVTPIVLVE